MLPCTVQAHLLHPPIALLYAGLQEALGSHSPPVTCPMSPGEGWGLVTAVL